MKAYNGGNDRIGSDRERVQERANDLERLNKEYNDRGVWKTD